MSIFNNFQPVVNVVSLRKNQTDSNIKAFLDIEITGFGVVCDCKIVQQAGQAAWLAMPDKPWHSADGKTKYKPVIKLAEPIKAKIEGIALAAWRNA